MLVLLNSGQTGVERGAHGAAVSAGLTVAGFMPRDGRDELGQVPHAVASSLTPFFERGPRPALKANIALASAVLIVVPEVRRADKFTAIGVIMQWVRSVRVPLLTCDPSTNLDDIVGFTTQIPETSGSMRLAVTGPRGTRWTEGHNVARRIVAAIAMRA
jgi:hypothetical protein